MSLVGRQIGRYRILEQLGQGGMSIVYKGLDTALDREVAVKVLHPHLATKLESRKRLEREAKAVARLHHPNILEVFDYAGADASEAYIVTEYIRGKTLKQFIAEEALAPPEIAAMVMHEVASALAHAHELGVIHRDLKPENVMVREDGLVKLTDFGIAKLLDREDKMTMTGALVGSPAHMAPEIIEGEEAGPEADVFSLGTMLYWCAVGKLPFVAANTTATLKRILDCVYEDPRQLDAGVSDALADVIAGCLQRKPSDRYPTASKLRDALALALAEAGLSRPNEELKSFFVEPKAYRSALVPRLTEIRLVSAEKLIAEKRVAKAMAALSLVLAQDPSNARAAQLLAQMKAKKHRAHRLKALVRGSLLLGLVGTGAAGAVKGWRVATEPPPYFAPIELPPTAVTLGNVAWPTKPAVPPAVLPVAAAVVADAGPEQPKGARPAVPKRPAVPLATPLQPSTPVIPVEVAVNIRPFGTVAIDDGAPSEARQSHQFSLPPGPHVLTISCAACDPLTQPLNVGNTPLRLNVAARLKPAALRFEGYPPQTQVRVGLLTKDTATTTETPFVIQTPPEGCKELRHHVRYEVSRQGVLIETAELSIDPGGQAVIRPGGPR
jgi:serine/threonine protein kinase